MDRELDTDIYLADSAKERLASRCAVRLAVRGCVGKGDQLFGVALLPVGEQRLVVGGDVTEMVIERALGAPECRAQSLDRQRVPPAASKQFEPGSEPIRAGGARRAIGASFARASRAASGVLVAPGLCGAWPSSRAQTVLAMATPRARDSGVYM